MATYRVKVIREGYKRSSTYDARFMEKHPELDTEQAYIDAAYDRLDQIRDSAKRRAAALARESTNMPGQRYDLDVRVRVALDRAESLDIGDESSHFPRIDAADHKRRYVG